MRKSLYTHNPPVKVIILDAAKRILESNEMEKMKQKNKTKATNVPVSYTHLTLPTKA